MQDNNLKSDSWGVETNRTHSVHIYIPGVMQMKDSTTVKLLSYWFLPGMPKQTKHWNMSKCCWIIREQVIPRWQQIIKGGMKNDVQQISPDSTFAMESMINWRVNLV